MGNKLFLVVLALIAIVVLAVVFSRATEKQDFGSNCPTGYSKPKAGPFQELCVLN